MKENVSIQRIFSEVPKTYERINHLLTFGLDILWRKKAVRIARRKGGLRWLDVCTGTGETAVYLARSASDNTEIFGVDLTMPMLQEAVRKPEGGSIHFAQADVRILPFPDRSFDLIVLSFATRNLNASRRVLIRTFSEFHRILKPGGWFVNLETSQPANLFIRRLFHLYIRMFVQKLGSRVSGSRIGYAYLASTIPRFYSTEELSGILTDSDFKSIRIFKICFGAVATHIGCREG